MLKTKILELLLKGKTDEEIISELSPGINLSPQDDKIVLQNPPKTNKPASYYNKNSRLRHLKEKGKYGIERDRAQTREFQS